MTVVVTEEMVQAFPARRSRADQGALGRLGRAAARRNRAQHGRAGPLCRREPEPRRGRALFFDDYCNWDRIPEFAEVIRKSEVADVAARLMGSQRVQLFHDHVLVKEPGTSKPTPWHQDGPYYFVAGRQTVSFWSPLDPVKEASLRCVAGSHRWPKEVLPKRWLSDTAFYPDPEKYMPVPDPDVEGMPAREWQMEPGDAVAFDYLTLHGARGMRRRRGGGPLAVPR